MRRRSRSTRRNVSLKKSPAWQLLAAVAVLVLATLSVSTPAHAGTYAPGTATAHKPVYNANTGNWDYSCSYNNWRSGAKVVFHCKLYEFACDQSCQYVLDKDNSNSWTPPPAYHNTATFHWPMTVGQGGMCVKASALSVDGGDSSNYVCA
jgi:hypothetical protein